MCYLMSVNNHKHNYAINEVLSGFRDPNVIPIKEFYESVT